MVSLRNRIYFPAYAEVPDEYTLPPLTYYYYIGEDFLKRKRRWCLLAEIDEAFFFIRMRLSTRDITGKEVPVHLYFKDHADYQNPSKFKAGHTIAIIDAMQHYFIDGTEGIRLEVPQYMQILEISLGEIWNLSDYLERAELSRVCRQCEKISLSALKCGRCKLTWYCDKECQKKDWSSRHRRECKATLQVDELMSFTWNDCESARGIKEPVTPFVDASCE